MPLVPVNNITRPDQLALLKQINKKKSAGLYLGTQTRFRIASTLARRGLVVLVEKEKNKGWAIAAGYWTETVKEHFERLAFG